METTLVMFCGQLLTVLTETLPMLRVGGFRKLTPEEVEEFRTAARESDGKVEAMFHPVYQDEILKSKSA